MELVVSFISLISLQYLLTSFHELVRLKSIKGHTIDIDMNLATNRQHAMTLDVV